jgi:hypothetical protein
LEVLYTFGTRQGCEDAGRDSFDGKELVALEVELRKAWKPTEESMTVRLAYLNGQSRFFDRTSVVFPEGAELSGQIRSMVDQILNRKRLYEVSEASKSED